MPPFNPAQRASWDAELARLDELMPSRPLVTAERLNRLIPLIRAQGDREVEARALCILGGCHFFQGEFAQTLALAHQAAELAQAQGQTALLSRALNAQGLARQRLGESGKALDAYVQALHLAQQQDDDLARCRVMNNMAALLTELGEYAEAHRLHCEMLELARQLEHSTYQSDALIWLAYQELAMGDAAAALQRAEQALELTRQVGQVRTEGNARAALSAVLRDLGRGDEALAQAEAALRLSREAGDQEGESELLGLLADLALRRGDTHEGQRLALESLALAQQLSYRAQERQALALLAHALESLGDWEGALRASQQHQVLAKEHYHHVMQGRVAALSVQARVDDLRRQAERERQRSAELNEANILLLQTQQELSYRASHDPLTGLFNRTHLREEWSRLLAQLGSVPCPQPGGCLGAVLVNIDRFKQVNEEHGYGVGDAVLIQVAQRLLMAVGDHDLVGRLGGDEFIVLVRCPACGDPEVLQREAVRLQAELSRPYRADITQVELSFSVGTALAPADGDDIETLSYRLTLALDEAKRHPGAGPQAYRPELSEADRQRKRMEQLLRAALDGQPDAGRLLLHYQPQFMLPQQELAGFEALVRWEHPEHGMVSPAEFIPLAEQTGLIVPLGQWVLREACRQTAEWDLCGRGIRMAVNVSVRQFEQPDFVEQVSQAISDSGISGQNLVLELTESLVMHDQTLALRHVTQLHRFGIKIAIDDFGTGYSSLSLLRELPFEHLKIDRSFVQSISSRLPAAEQSRAMVFMRAILDMAHGLDLTVIAEGIEDEDQLKLLEALGCDKVQGFLLGRPVSPEEAEQRWL